MLVYGMYSFALIGDSQQTFFIQMIFISKLREVITPVFSSGICSVRNYLCFSMCRQ